MSLLSTQIDEKIKLFDKIKKVCNLIDTFTIPLFYFERSYLDLVKNKSDNLKMLEIHNNISNVSQFPETHSNWYFDRVSKCISSISSPS